MVIGRILTGGVVLFLTGCAWTPRAFPRYPHGFQIIRAEQFVLDEVCSHYSDDGVYIKHARGCYDRESDVIFVLDSCEGAEALPHELAHRYGIAKPKQAGFNW